MVTEFFDKRSCVSVAALCPAPHNADRGYQNRQWGVGRAEDAGAALEGAVEVCAVGADSPRRAGSTEVSRAWKPGSTEETDIGTLGEGAGARGQSRIPGASQDWGAGRRASDR